MTRSLIAAVLTLSAVSGTHVYAQFVGQTPNRADFARQPVLNARPEQMEQLLKAPAPALHISAGDLLEVHIFNLTSYDTRVRVGNSGKAIFPLIGELQVADQSVEEVETELVSRLQQAGMVRDPHVTILLTETPTQVATISGDVNRPGNYPLNGKHTLLQMISAAQGMKDTASHTVVLMRPGMEDPITIELGSDPTHSRYANIALFAGDTVIVSPVGVYYVVGAVKNSGVYALKDATPTTVIEAVGAAGGVGYEADGGNARLIRHKGTANQQEIKLDLDKVLHGKSEDLLLETDDILLIPTSKMKAVVKGGGAGLAVSLASALIYLH